MIENRHIVPNTTPEKKTRLSAHPDICPQYTAVMRDKKHIMVVMPMSTPPAIGSIAIEASIPWSTCRSHRKKKEPQAREVKIN